MYNVDFQSVFGQLEVMTRLLALLSQLLWFAALALLASFVGSVVNLCLSEQIRPQHPNLNALANRSNTHLLRLSGTFFDWLRKTSLVFHEFNGRRQLGRRIGS